MTTLLQRCQAVTAKAQQLKLAQRHANQQRQVQERTREWTNCNNRLKVVSARVACLSLDADGGGGVVERRAQLRHNAVQVLELLKSHDDIAQLTADSSWERLLASVEGLSAELERFGKIAWKIYIDDQGALEDPAWLRTRAPSTPLNDAAIAAYERQYAVYASLVRLVLPRGPDDLAQLTQIISACRIEAANVRFDVPHNVQTFFQAVQSGSATLASLKPGVLEWLTENGQLERYRIRSAG